MFLLKWQVSAYLSFLQYILLLHMQHVCDYQRLGLTILY